MILPIVAYGDPILKKVAKEIDSTSPNISELINNMFETMHSANGVGLAAPQIGLSVRLFIVDTSSLSDEEGKNEYLRDFKRVFINPTIIKEDDDEWKYNEGCLSIPEIREDILRKPKIFIHYLDANFNKCEENFDGIPARIVQHEYDHLEGILFTDHLSALKRRLLKRKLTDISKGEVQVDYKMRFYSKKDKKYNF